MLIGHIYECDRQHAVGLLCTLIVGLYFAVLAHVRTSSSKTKKVKTDNSSFDNSVVCSWH